MLKNKRTLEIAGLITESEYKFHIELPPSIQVIYDAFHKHGKKLYVVGGAVRDALLGKTPKDFDLATDAIPSVVQDILNKSNIRNFPKGESYGVISAVIDGEEFELATFRTEDYTGGDGRRPNEDSIAYTDIEQDVKRRDLTINALYYDIATENIIDLVGGVEDIKNGRVRTVGNPYDRFQEDRLRTLRALRFAHRLGSTLDQDTIKAILHFKDLPGVSAERIRDEFLKALKSALKPEEFLSEYINLGLMPRTFPGMNIDPKVIPGLNHPCLVIAKLLHENSIDSVMKALETSTYSNDEKSTIMFLLKFKNRFSHFDKLIFDDKIDGKWLIGLIKERDIILNQNLLTRSDILKWAGICKINRHICSVFMDFKPSFTRENFPHLPQGRELGQAIESANVNDFLKKL